ncbi:SocA family protein [Bacillus sp. H-16]|uniref:Panacea domain-containing protein n=1 Tax=Alteribacter salitolerans TaxID=2912333 RepID=UPI001966AF66|nr:type II toxin-antitoxin system antitoxin SocA domain-containing protein [Alteribacter salitolerans]MBM7096662.1 SocA family protein [Alteribacter salitolerans]
MVSLFIPRKISVLDVSDYFLSRSVPGTNQAITHLKLQKLVYFAQAWHLALTGKKIFENRIEAWTHGPVVPELYSKYKAFGFRELPKKEDVKEATFEKDVLETLGLVWELYGDKEGKVLENITHNEDPWIEARRELSQHERSNVEISTYKMEEYFKNEYIQQ